MVSLEPAVACEAAAWFGLTWRVSYSPAPPVAPFSNIQQHWLHLKQDVNTWVARNLPGQLSKIARKYVSDRQVFKCRRNPTLPPHSPLSQLARIVRMRSSWYIYDSPQSIPHGLSTLEVIPQNTRDGESFKELPPPSGLEVLSRGAASLSKDARHSYFDAPEVAYSPQSSPRPNLSSSPLPASSDGSSEGLFSEKEGNDNHKARRTICNWAAKRCWLFVILAVLTVAVVVGLVVGIVVGLRNAHRKHESASKASSSQASGTGSGIDNGFSIGVSNSSSLAAIAFNDTLGVVHHRVYYQDDAGIIKESSWNTSGNLWQVSNSAIGQAKTNTPLTAIVTGPPQYGFVSNNF